MGSFKRVMRRTILQEIRRIRLEGAKRLLRETNLTMDRIAERSCIGTRQHLCHIFKQLVGMSPKHYRYLSRNP